VDARRVDRVGGEARQEVEHPQTTQIIEWRLRDLWMVL
jgi:hypothetical protein